MATGKELNMSNNNLRNCEKAIAQLNLTDRVKITIGKNPKQATRLSFGEKSVSVSALYKVDEFINLLENALSVNSVASSKYNGCNADNDIDELQMWNERQATYTKKNIYNYKENNLNTILMWTVEDFGYTLKDIETLHNNWNNDPETRIKADLKRCKDLLYKNGMYVARASLEQTCKEWLTAHDLYDHNVDNINLIIDKWIRIGG